MVLDGSDPKAKIAINMQTLAGKTPVSADVDEGEPARNHLGGRQ